MEERQKKARVIVRERVREMKGRDITTIVKIDIPSAFLYISLSASLSLSFSNAYSFSTRFIIEVESEVTCSSVAA